MINGPDNVTLNKQERIGDIIKDISQLVCENNSKTTEIHSMLFAQPSDCGENEFNPTGIEDQLRHIRTVISRSNATVNEIIDRL
jgi:hypothetical protein